jgi:hypothetical protein
MTQAALSFLGRRAALAVLLAATVPLASAQAQAPMLYEQRLPEGTAFIRFINGLPGEAAVKADFAPAFTQGSGDADRVGPYVPAQKVVGRDAVVELTEGGQTVQVTLRFEAGYNTVVLARKGGTLVATRLSDALEFNQTRARLAFYNVIPDCPDGSLTLQGSSQAVFTGVAPNTAKARTVNPSAAQVVAACGGKPAPVLDLSLLEAGGQYSVWLMAPAGTPVTLLARDRIGARR